MGIVESSVKFQCVMGILLLIGAWTRRRGILTPEGRRSLMDLIIDVIFPCNIVCAFLGYEGEVKGSSFLVVLGMACLVLGICILLTKILYLGEEEAAGKVLRYDTLLNNASFLGNPVAEALFGSQGLAYASVYVIPMRIATWTIGLSYFTCRKEDWRREVKKMALHPCIIAVYIGVLLMIFPIPLPEILTTSLSSLGRCMFAMVMITIGSCMEPFRVRDLLDRRILVYTFIRIVLIPVLVLLVCRILRIGGVLEGVLVILASMPAPSLTPLLADKYGGDVQLANHLMIATLIVSMFAVPVYAALMRGLGMI